MRLLDLIILLALGILAILDIATVIMMATWKREQHRESEASKRQIFDMQRRMTTFEVQLEHRPTHRDLRVVLDKIELVAASVSTVRGQSDTSVQLLRSIQQHLLEKDR